MIQGVKRDLEGEKGDFDKGGKGVQWDILQRYRGKIKAFWSTILSQFERPYNGNQQRGFIKGQRHKETSRMMCFQRQ